MKAWRIILICLGLLPFLFIIPLLAFYFHADYILGYLPSYGHPDPKALGIYPVYTDLIYLAAVVWMCSLFVLLPILIAYLIHQRKNISWKLAAFTIPAHLVALALIFSEIFEWFVD